MKHLIKTLVGAVAGVMLLANVASAQNARMMMDQVGFNTIKVCVEGAYPPFSSISPSGELVGFDIDIAKALVEAMGRNIKLVAVDWDGIIPALLAKKCDAIIASMSITEERKKTIDFSEKYYGNAPLKFVGKKGERLSDRESFLKKKKVGLQRGTIFEDYMKKHYPKVKLNTYGSNDEAIADVVSGRLDAMIADKVTLDELLKNESSLTYFGKDHRDDSVLGVGVGVGVRKADTKLRDAFSQAVKDIRKSGEYKKINNQYFDFDIYK